MDLRDWLIVVGVIILLGILLDGYRRMRIAKKDSLKFAKGMGGGNIDQSPLDDDYNPELPGGGARIVARGEDSDGSEAQLDLNVTHDATNSIDRSKEPTLNDVDPIALDDDIHSAMPFSSEQSVSEQSVSEQSVSEQSVSEQSVSEQSGSDQSASEKIVAERDHVIDEGSSNDVIVANPSRRKKNSRSKTNQEEPDTKESAEAGAPEEVLVINVDAKTSQGFPGSALKELLEACGMDHGEMSIFHRHEEDDLLSPIQFSVANAVEPGYFDPASIETLNTPGVSFFMGLPGPKDYMKAFDYMLETAQVFARQLDGELKDENRSVMTVQTIEHCRQRIREYERKQLSKVLS